MLVRVGLYAALGVVSTWGVAWGLAAWQPLGNYTYRHWQLEEPAFPPGIDWWSAWFDLTEYKRVGTCRRLWMRHAVSSNPGWDAASPIELLLYPSALDVASGDPPFREPAFTGFPPPSSGFEGVQLFHGWPLRSNWCDLELVIGRPYGAPSEFRAPGGIALGKRQLAAWDLSHARALPLRPLWTGLLVNTAFYAGAWFLLIGGRRSIRTWLRGRRGLCPACAYDLRATPGACPECGWGVPASR